MGNVDLLDLYNLLLIFDNGIHPLDYSLENQTNLLQYAIVKHFLKIVFDILCRN